MRETAFTRFIRSHGASEIVLDLRPPRFVFERKDWVEADLAERVDALRGQLREADRENEAFLWQALGPHMTGPLPSADMMIESTLAQFRQSAGAIANGHLRGQQAESGLDQVIGSDFDSLEAYLVQRFQWEINEQRQAAAGVTHFVWRTRDDAKVRQGHAERDDRVFAWSFDFEDGPPGHAPGCRCIAEPAVVDGTIFLAARPIDPGLASRISRAQGRGLERAAADAAVGTVMSVYDVLRFSYLGYRRLFGVITPEEEAERLTAREGVQAALAQLLEFDAETMSQIAEEAVDLFDARHAEVRLLDIEYRLGLVDEATLLQAYEDVAHMDASVLMGGTGFAVAASRLGVDLLRLRPRSVLPALRAARVELDALTAARAQEATAFISRRFAELERQGHGPGRHEGAVTRAMLEERVLRGVDPLTGTTSDGVTGWTHRAPTSATRIASEAAYVGAEGVIRRSSAYQLAYEAAVRDGGQGSRFRVSLPIEDALGPDYRMVVEGVRRIGPKNSPSGVADIDFTGGQVVAVFDVGPQGEPALVTLYPEGAR